jgi:hypothetical protein
LSSFLLSRIIMGDDVTDFKKLQEEVIFIFIQRNI